MAPAATRGRRIVRVALQTLAMTLAAAWFLHLVWPLVSARPPAAILDTDSQGQRFGIPESERRQIFLEIARREAHDRPGAEQKFPGRPWSIEDDVAAAERDQAREVAREHGVSLTQVYLVLDEGVRAHWPSPDGAPLPATITPLSPRRE